MSKYYILNGKEIEACDDIGEWSKFMQSGDRHVAQIEEDGICVSTVFLSLDHAFNGGAPVLFETMIFGGEHDQYQERYTTWEDAEKGHKKACELVNIKDK